MFRWERVLGMEDGADLLDQFPVRVGLRKKPAKTAREHAADPRLLAKTTAENHTHIGIDRFQFIENGVPIHDRQKIIEEHQIDLAAEAPVDSQGLDAVAGGDEPVIFELENVPRS